MNDERRKSWLVGPGLVTCFGASLALVGCGGAPAVADAEANRTPELVIFVYDRSASIPDYQLELARELTRDRIARLKHGDRIAAVQVLQLSLDEPPLRWSQSVPRREWAGMDVARDSITLARFLRDADAYLRAFSDPASRDDIMGTDVLSTFHDVAAELRPYRDYRTVVYIYSDMLQSGHEIEMEGLRKMPPDDWVQARSESERLPDLSGLCVVVVGGRVDTKAGQRVKTFWSDYFEATGASLFDHNYSLRPVSLPTDPCPGI